MIIDSLLAFLCVSVSVSLLLSLYTMKRAETRNMEEAVERFKGLNGIYYEEGADERYEDMFMRVQSY